VAEYGFCQFQQCDREAIPAIVAWPEGRFRLCAMHQPFVHHRLTDEKYRWRLTEQGGRIDFVEKIPWDPIGG
jgi:hypothetical protein